jgi:hypothetical protein
MDLKIEVKLGNLLWIYFQLGSILEYSLTKNKIKKLLMHVESLKF